MSFDFSKLTDREFETLCASVIEKILKKRVEIFKSGKDGGVDGRFWIKPTREGIIQCKHYSETPFSNLLSKLKTSELQKVQKLGPSKYIFMTSKKLSRSNKQEIKKIFKPYIKNEKDIYGYEDLNQFLSKKENQDVVERNYKLWITSTTVLEIIFNSAIKGRSQNTIRDIEESAYRYAVTKNHLRGLEILDKNNAIILTGEPGIGKTTLADNLALYYTAKGFEFCDIEEDISEAEQLFRNSDKKKMLFYCDDFLGSNLYDAINNKRDSHILKFIERVRKDDSKKFILTSRTNILNKAYSLSHRFQNGKIRENELLLSIDFLTDVDKAKILYNHIYHSGLEDDYIDKIYHDKRYREIINHKNFNPRIIEFFTDNVRVSHIAPKQYWSFIVQNLNKPEQIWADYFQNQTDDCVRALTFLTVYNNGKISEELLRISYDKFLTLHPVNLGDHSDKSFEAVRKLATKSLLNRNQQNDKKFEYGLFNPSIADFILNSYSKETELISNILKSLGSENSLAHIRSIILFKKIDKPTWQQIQANLFQYFFEIKMEEKDWDFLILLSYLDMFNRKVSSQISNFLTTVIETEILHINRIWELLQLIREFEENLSFGDFEFLGGLIENISDEETLKDLLNLIEEYNIENENILSQIEVLVEEYLDGIIENTDLDIDYSKYVNQYYWPDGHFDYDIDMSAVESEVEESLNSFLNELNQTVLDRISFDTSRFVSNLDLDHMVNTYLERYETKYESSHYDHEPTSISYGDDIDAIFERP